MNWIALFKSVLSVAVYISKYLSDKQLLELGEDRAIAAQLKDLNAKMAKSTKARIDSMYDSDNGGLYNDDGHKRKS